MLSISFEVDVPTRKVGSSLFFECRRCELPRGVWGCTPQKILKFRCLEMLFSTFSWQYLGLRAIKIKTILTIFYVNYNRSFPQNLYHWLLEKSEMINLQMLIQRNTFNVLSSSSPIEKMCSAMPASVSLARMPLWNMRKPGI